MPRDTLLWSICFEWDGGAVEAEDAVLIERAKQKAGWRKCRT